MGHLCNSWSDSSYKGCGTNLQNYKKKFVGKLMT
jgi:hypothetical protein